VSPEFSHYFGISRPDSGPIPVMVKRDVIEKLVNTLFEESDVKTWTIYHDKFTKDTVVKVRFASHDSIQEDSSQITYTKKSMSQVKRGTQRAQQRKKRKISDVSTPEIQRSSNTEKIYGNCTVDSPEHVVVEQLLTSKHMVVDRAEHECTVTTPATILLDNTGEVLHSPIPQYKQLDISPVMLPSSPQMCNESMLNENQVCDGTHETHMVKTENGLVNCPNCDEFMADWDHECEMEYETSESMDDAKDDNDMGTKKDECDWEKITKVFERAAEKYEKKYSINPP